jgi:A/G-specific adenine glycosylase
MIKRDFFVKWSKANGRAFPWRKPGTSPFALLVTEMLLRQTRAAAVEKIWKKLIMKYPDARSMARANRRDLKNIISILGFGRMRSHALKSAAKWLVEQHGGSVPDDLQSLMQIPHIGTYSAQAILCFVFGHKTEIVDGNVVRFFGRYYGINVKPDIRRNPEVVRLARESLPREGKKVLLHNYGILDFTAEVCRPVTPRCEICPLVSSCQLGKKPSTKLTSHRQPRLQRKL